MSSPQLLDEALSAVTWRCRLVLSFCSVKLATKALADRELPIFNHKSYHSRILNLHDQVFEIQASNYGEPILAGSRSVCSSHRPEMQAIRLANCIVNRFPHVGALFFEDTSIFGAEAFRTAEVLVLASLFRSTGICRVAFDSVLLKLKSLNNLILA